VVLADVNVLVAAFRADHPNHVVARRWLEGVIASPQAFGASDLVSAAVVRITTNRHAFRDPSEPAEAFEFVNAIREAPHAVAVAPGPRHWGILERLIDDTQVRGNLVTDAYFAALAIEHGCEWITFDADFARFPGLKWRRPDERTK
jgi:toxin-antitoxin system PIN domain toxin